MNKLFSFEHTLDRVGAVFLLSQALLLGVATATVGLPVWA